MDLLGIIRTMVYYTISFSCFHVYFIVLLVLTSPRPLSISGSNDVVMSAPTYGKSNSYKKIQML